MKTYTEKIATSFQEHSLLRMKIIANLRVTLNVPDEEKVEYAVVKMERIRFSLALQKNGIFQVFWNLSIRNLDIQCEIVQRNHHTWR